MRRSYLALLAASPEGCDAIDARTAAPDNVVIARDCVTECMIEPGYEKTSISV